MARTASHLLPLVVLFTLLTLAAPAAAEPLRAPGLRLLHADTMGAQLELYTPIYRMTNEAGGSALSVEGYATRAAPGLPALPVVFAPLALPRAGVPQLTITLDDAVVLALPAALARSPGPVLVGVLDYAANPAAAGRLAPIAALPSAGLDPPVAAQLVGQERVRGQLVAQVALYPFQVDAANNRLIWHRSLRVELRFAAASRASSSVAAAASPFDAAVGAAVLNGAALAGRSAMALHSTAANAPAPNNACATASGSVKLLVRQAGLYAFTLAELAAAGLTLADASALHLYRSACSAANEVALHQQGATLRFYGEPSTSRYSDTTVYWLRAEATPGLRMPTRSVLPASAPLRTSYTAVAAGTLAADTSASPRRPFYDWAYGGADGDHFFLGDVRFGRPLTLSLELAWPLPAPATLELVAQGVTPGQHQLNVYLNSIAPANLVEQWFWPGGGLQGTLLATRTLTLPAGALQGPQQLLILEVPNELPPDVAQIDRVTLRYEAQLRAVGDRLLFAGASGPQRYTLGGLAGAAALLYDVGNALRPVLLEGAAVVPGPEGSVQFEDGPAAATTYALSAPGAELRFGAGELLLDTPAQLEQGAADYLMIGYGAFLPATEPLAAHYRSSGLRVASVNVQDIYDQWSGGALDPEAIRAFLRYAYMNWSSPPPTYVLLVGDGSYDFRNQMGLGWANYMPPYLITGDPWTNEVACDTCYARLDGDNASADGLPDMLVGRLPVASLEQATTVVSKTLGYISAPPEGAWRTRALFLADNYYDRAGNTDGAGDFADYTERAIKRLPPGIEVRRFLYDPSPLRAGLPGFYDTPDPLRMALRASIEEGAAIWSYIGHASYWQWAFTEPNATPPYLWYLYDADSLNNGGRLPLLFSMTCLTGFFQQPELPTTDERLLTREGGGIIASFSPAGLGVASGHDIVQRAMTDALYSADPQQRSFGAAQLASNLALQNGGCCRDLAFSYELLGDPAARLPFVATDWVWMPVVGKGG